MSAGDQTDRRGFVRTVVGGGLAAMAGVVGSGLRFQPRVGPVRSHDRRAQYFPDLVKAIVDSAK